MKNKTPIILFKGIIHSLLLTFFTIIDSRFGNNILSFGITLKTNEENNAQRQGKFGLKQMSKSYLQGFDQ